jgi:hypothetical protein
MFPCAHSDSLPVTPLALSAQLIDGRERVLESGLQSSPSQIGSNFTNPRPKTSALSMWSDSSDGEDKTTTQRLPELSETCDSLPDDFVNEVTHPTSEVVSSPPSAKVFLPSTHLRTEVTDLNNSRPEGRTRRSDAVYCRSPPSQQDHHRTNHYFREKKWEFFPELAPYCKAGESMTPKVHPIDMKKRDCPMNLFAKPFGWNQVALGWAHSARGFLKVCVKQRPRNGTIHENYVVFDRCDLKVRGRIHRC